MAITVTSVHVISLTFLITLFMTSDVSSQSTFYNSVTLNKYVRLCQQLRQELSRKLTALSNRVTSLQSHQTFTDVQMRLMMDVTSARALLTAKYNIVRPLQSIFRQTSVLKLSPTTPYTDVTKPIFGDVILNHGFDYNSEQGVSYIMRTGVYMLEMKMQGVSQQAIAFSIYVFGSDFSPKYSITMNTGSEVIPWFRLLELEQGDTFLTLSMANTNANLGADRVMTGPATQFILRYLGTGSA